MNFCQNKVSTKKFFFLYFRKNITRWSVGRLRIGQVFSVSSTTLCRLVAINCCWMYVIAKVTAGDLLAVSLLYTKPVRKNYFPNFRRKVILCYVILSPIWSKFVKQMRLHGTCSNILDTKYLSHLIEAKQNPLIPLAVHLSKQGLKWEPWRDLRSLDYKGVLFLMSFSCGLTSY